TPCGTRTTHGCSPTRARPGTGSSRSTWRAPPVPRISWTSPAPSTRAWRRCASTRPTSTASAATSTQTTSCATWPASSAWPRAASTPWACAGTPPDEPLARACPVDLCDRPDVRGLAGLHQLEVPLGHFAQRRLAVEPAAFLQRVHRLRLPSRPGAAGQTALFDDTEQALGFQGVDASLAQAVKGQRQQPPQGQFRGRHLTKAGPVQPCLDPVLGCLHQVVVGSGEGH